MSRDAASSVLLPLSVDVIAADGDSVTARVHTHEDGPHIIQLFSSPKCSASGAEGNQRLIGQAFVTLSTSEGPAAWQVVTVPLSQLGMQDRLLTATVSSPLATSVFSQCLRLKLQAAACELCTCSSASGGGQQVDCEARGLRDIPEGLPADTSRLLMGRNQLTFMHSLSRAGSRLAGLSRLAHLDLSSAGIAVLPAQLLAGLTALKTLLLSRNELPTLATVNLRSDGMPALETLDASYNRITEVPIGYVSGTAMVTLLLRGNAIASLRNGSCGEPQLLQAVDLAENPLGALECAAFAGSSSLHTLDLSRKVATQAAVDDISSTLEMYVPHF